MSRRPLPPRLTWSDDGVPVAETFDDVYFSKADGLAETETVFLNACDLPNAWSGRRSFCIGELGFGTGLNALAVWRLWQVHRPSPDARLHFVSFEKHPLSDEEAQIAHRHWPDLDTLSRQLVDVFPPQVYGYHRRWFDTDGFVLTVIHGDVSDTLPKFDGSIDAWFLDGFSPARNDQMWTDDVFREVARNTAPGARLGTYTVAGKVRRGLTAAGFDVEKAPGFANKRERLVATFSGAPARRKPNPLLPPSSALKSPPRSVLVVGAGIAGASVARAFARRGAKVSVAGRNPMYADGASGNPLALLMPRLDASETPTSRFLINAYLDARALYSTIAADAVTEVTVQQLARSDEDTKRFATLKRDPPLGEVDLQFETDGDCVTGLYHHNALILQPRKIVQSLLNHPNITVREQTVTDLDDETDAADLVVIANGLRAMAFSEASWLPLAGRAGQVDYFADDALHPPQAIAGGHYLLKDQGCVLFGATFEPTDSPEHEVSPAARASNIEAVLSLSPDTVADLALTDLQSRASVRATTPDRLPIAGFLPDRDRFLETFGDLRHGMLADAEPPFVANIAVLNGLGARGFTFAPIAGELIASQAFTDPLPLVNSEAELLSPARFLVRDLKKRRV